MSIRKPVNQMTPDELRAFVTEHRKKQLERSQRAAERKKEIGHVRLTIYVPEGAREIAREAAVRAAQEWEKTTKFPFDELKED